MATPPVIPLTLPLPALPKRPNPKEPKGADVEVRQWAEQFSRSMQRYWAQIANEVAHPTPGPHASTHRPDTGGDPLLTGTPSGGYGTSAALGSGGALLRSDARFPFPEALGTLADRTKTITLTDDVSFGPSLKPSSTWTGGIPLGLALFSATGTTPVVIGPNGTMGRGAYLDYALLQHGNVSISNSNRVYGWFLQGLTATGTGGITGLFGSNTYNPSATDTNEIIGLDWTVKAGNTGAQFANGSIIAVRGTIASPAGNSSGRGAIIVFSAKTPTTALLQTYPSATYFDCTQVFGSGGTISGAVVGFRQGTVFGNGTPRRGVQVQNSIECVANDIIVTGAGKRVMMKDAIDGHFYALSFQNGTLMITDIGTAAPNT